MSEGRGEAPAPAPRSFALSAEEAAIAASRAGLRAFLSARARAHLAELVGFALFVIFVVILTTTGLVGRRFGESALIGGAIVFMALRLTAHRRLRSARAASLAAAAALHGGGEATIRLSEAALDVEGPGGARRLPFVDCDEAEEAGGVIYLWPRVGEPAFIPVRAFPDQEAARQFLAYIRARLGRRRG
jgi:hypothetical protein